MARVYPPGVYRNVAGSSRRSDEAKIRLKLPSSNVPNESGEGNVTSAARLVPRSPVAGPANVPSIRCRTDDQSGDAVILLCLDEKVRRGTARPGDLWLTCSLTPPAHRNARAWRARRRAGRTSRKLFACDATVGSCAGHAFIRGGRAAIRRPSTCQRSSRPASIRESNKLTNAGKPAKIAVTIMRKLRVLANALLKANPELDPKIRLIKTDTLACTVAAA
jgi:hypothetical protein